VTIAWPGSKEIIASRSSSARITSSGSSEKSGAEGSLESSMSTCAGGSGAAGSARSGLDCDFGTGLETSTAALAREKSIAPLIESGIRARPGEELRRA
jgi:hypothetical protein